MDTYTLFCEPPPPFNKSWLPQPVLLEHACRTIVIGIYYSTVCSWSLLSSTCTIYIVLHSDSIESSSLSVVNQPPLPLSADVGRCQKWAGLGVGWAYTTLKMALASWSLEQTAEKIRQFINYLFGPLSHRLSEVLWYRRGACKECGKSLEQHLDYCSQVCASNFWIGMMMKSGTTWIVV